MKHQNLPANMPESFKITLTAWPVSKKSPYSNSYYDTKKKRFGYAPTGSHRISDHWNFEYDGKLHCCTDRPVAENHWALAQWDGTRYIVLQELPSE